MSKIKQLHFNPEIWEVGDDGSALLSDGHHIRLQTALIGLKMEATNEHGLLFTRISSLGVLKQYFNNLARTKKGAYKQLVAHGLYKEDSTKEV